MVTLRTESLEAQETLEEIDAKGREKRAQLGFAVDQLGVDGSKAKEDLRTARDAQKHAEEECEGCARALRGRPQGGRLSGRAAPASSSPRSDLAQAYRDVADAVDEWIAYRSEERRATEAPRPRSATPTTSTSRSASSAPRSTKHEQELDDEREKCRGAIEASGKEADASSRSSSTLTTRFCEPLRTRPELAPLFKELEMEAAASAA